MNDGSKQKIPAALIESVEEDLPTPDEIEIYAAKGMPPESWGESHSEYTAKIMLALTRRVYQPKEAEKLWRAIVEHENWLAERIDRKPGISVAALDYLLNVANEWDKAVVSEADQIKNLADVATQDGLTGLYVREVFDQWLEKSVAESRRYGVPFSLLMADIDDFKKVNDKHGHPTGDRVLKRISTNFLKNLRSADFAARYGGEELVALLPHTGLDSARMVAEKIRRTVRNHFRHNMRVTIIMACWGWPENDIQVSR